MKTRHPYWCAADHTCTAGRGAGEHASRPEVFRTELGRLVATRYRDDAGRDRVELRQVIRLDPDERTAVEQCRTLVAATHRAARQALGHD